jgi:transcriptional regulator GlxA family with amidase domain
LSQSHFLRLFKQAFGVTPHQYLRQVRLQKARQLLVQKNLSVTEVCLSVGFDNLSSFSRLFSQTFGFSPRQMRPPHDPAAK